MPLLISGALHLALAFLLLLASSTLFTGQKTEEVVEALRPTRLVFLIAAGPGGGGGGGGQQTPRSPTPLRLKAPPRAVHDISTPIRIARRPPPRSPAPDPPRPTPSVPLSVEPPKQDPPKPDPPRPPPPVVQAPVAPRTADSVTTPGVLDSTTAMSRVNAGSGTGEGSGSGTGIGSGRGAGLGPGFDAGVGGGPFRAGSDIQPPRLIREVKPLYTEEARKRAVQGSVVLDVVVRRDGSVGSVAVVRSLGAGLDERAIDAVRQWRFAPAERRGAPVDVQVQVSVQFTLR